MILGGALGNLVDRFFRSPGPLRGHVVDFLSMGWWPVFNVADPAVVGGAILLVVLSLFGFDFDTAGRRRPDRRIRPGPDEKSAGEAGCGRATGRVRLMTTRSMPVPEGLAGMRVDAGLARLLGLSRTVAARDRRGGRRRARRCRRRQIRQARSPAPGWRCGCRNAPAPMENTPVEIEGMTILYADDDIVAVDKPVGVAAHASVGWTGPTVLGGLAAAGFRITTSGVPERKGIVQRLDVGTSGVMVVAISERAYTVLKRAFKGTHRGQALPRAGAGASRSVQRHHRRAHRRATVARTGSSR